VINQLVREREYRVSVSGVPAGFYARAVLYGGEDVLSNPFKFSGLRAGGLEIVLRPGPGQVAGRVTDSSGKGVPAAQAVLVPVQSHRIDLYKTAVADGDGRFTIGEIPPGDYRVFSWEAISQYRYLDPDLQKRDVERGRAVRIAEFATVSADVPFIPAEDPR